MIYPKSKQTAVAANMASAASGLKRNNKPGRVLASVVSQTALMGSSVFLSIRAKNFRSGNPSSY
jgi:hypothetical protein